MKNIIQPNKNLKSATEIAILTAQLEPALQAYVLNTINTLIFAQEQNKVSKQ